MTIMVFGLIFDNISVFKFSIQDAVAIKIKTSTINLAFTNDCVNYVDHDEQSSFPLHLWKVVTLQSLGKTRLFVAHEGNIPSLYRHISISLMLSQKQHLRVGFVYGSQTKKEVERDISSWSDCSLLLLLYDMKDKGLYVVIKSSSFGIRSFPIAMWPTTWKLVSDNNGKYIGHCSYYTFFY